MKYIKEFDLVRLTEEYVRFLRDSQGENRDSRGMRFGQKMWNLYGNGIVERDRYDYLNDPFYIEHHRDAYNMIFDDLTNSGDSLNV